MQWTAAAEMYSFKNSLLSTWLFSQSSVWMWYGDNFFLQRSQVLLHCLSILRNLLQLASWAPPWGFTAHKNAQCFCLNFHPHSAKTWQYDRPVFTHFVQFFSGYPPIYRSCRTVQVEQNVPNFCEGVSIESRVTMLTKAVCTLSAVAVHHAKVGFIKERYPSIQTGACPAWIGRGWKELPVVKGRK